jgi:hypothetical protein
MFGIGRSFGAEQSIPALLAYGREIGAEAGEALLDRNPEFQKLAPRASQDYLEYICAHERTEARNLLAHELDGRFRYFDLAEDFGRHNYERVRDMFDLVDFRSCRRFVLAGCGPLPMTLYHVHDKTDAAELLAIVVDADAIATVAEMARRFGLRRLSARAIAGEQFDYSGADVIYVANLVRPKRLVLQRIAETAPRSATIVLRDPYSLGRLLTERGTDVLDRRLEIAKVASPELSHFSRHVFLRFAALGTL